MKPSSNLQVDNLPKNSIIMWYGSSGDVPQGWGLCNGATYSGVKTPDLRGRFAVGADSGDRRGDDKYYNLGDTGGENEVVLTLETMPSHSHNINCPITQSGTGDSSHTKIYDAAKSGNSSGTTSVGGSKAHENRPPFLAVFFIMKLE